MTQGTLPADSLEAVLAECIAALKRLAVYRLPPALDRRLLWLSENKEKLSQAEREELLAAVEFSEERSIEKVHAQAALKRLGALYPDLVSAPL